MEFSIEYFKENKLKIGVGLIAVLLVANFISWLCSGWGLITVKVKDAPLGQVIKSIEWQGWVKIYSNIDPQSKVTMYCDHVPLADALETLSVNIDDSDDTAGNAGAGGNANGSTTAYQAGGGNDRGFGGGGFRRGMGGSGGGVQWHLGFFVAPTAQQVREEIRTFTEGADRDDDTLHTYNFPTALTLIQDDDISVPDPRQQKWPGLKMPPPPQPDASGNMPTDRDGNPLQPEPAPNSVQGYLKAFARQSDIWIMTPTTWDTPVSAPPAPNDSLVSAIRHFISGAHGSVTEAIILRGREHSNVAVTDRPRGNGGGGGFDISMMDDRVDNAINGLPREQQPIARAKVQVEKDFQKQIAALPWEDRRRKMMEHFASLMMAGDRNWRRSPEKRAQMMARMVSNRIAATGK